MLLEYMSYPAGYLGERHLAQYTIWMNPTVSHHEIYMESQHFLQFSLKHGTGKKMQKSLSVSLAM